MLSHGSPTKKGNFSKQRTLNMWRALWHNFAGGALFSSVKDYQTEHPMLLTGDTPMQVHDESPLDTRAERV